MEMNSVWLCFQPLVVVAKALLCQSGLMATSLWLVSNLSLMFEFAAVRGLLQFTAKRLRE